MKSQAGFSLAELLIAMTVMLLISGAAVTALLKMSTTQSTIWNRTQMHSGIRGATEVLQQEVGQAGRIALISGSATCTNNTTVPCLNANVTGSTTPQTVDVTSICGMFVGENLTVDIGTSQETVAITQINGAASDPTATQCPTGATVTAGNITGIFTISHNQYAVLQALGGFFEGVVPTTATNGSTAAVLKLFGDINADGNIVYVEYSISPACICSGTCSPSTTTGNLYRNSMSWNVASKTPASASQILLSNITQNPNGTQCFTLQPQTVNGNTYVTDVAVTLTVQTQLLDPVTKTYQTETKALLNVSPRNVFNTWELASSGSTARVQPRPASITTLLAGPS
ncbi:MAG TPA: prepilin-type N-terminal cleavage/methylation domain-containing protein [Vicinamibacterales bacterium]|jgi:prepilin-type N-terminal cleavage/methylation domain-containing protein|nr:prepilin-type N-terminal cleavage/methylation domain-containing protein [Vicinamibacterales bacterium]